MAKAAGASIVVVFIIKDLSDQEAAVQLVIKNQVSDDQKRDRNSENAQNTVLHRIKPLSQ